MDSEQRQRAPKRSVPYPVQGRVDEETFRWLQERADLNGGSMSEALRQAVALAIAATNSAVTGKPVPLANEVSDEELPAYFAEDED